MNRFSRINTIWRKELVDTLRDRRTLVAMVLVPIVLYPALLLGSMQALEVQVSNLVQEKYTIGVPSQGVADWLQRVLDMDAAVRHYAPPEGAGESEADVAGPQGTPEFERRGAAAARDGVRDAPPPYDVRMVPDVTQAVLDGDVHVGVLLESVPPSPGDTGSTRMRVVRDETDIRSEIAATGLEGVFARINERLLAARLAERSIDPALLEPYAVESLNVAPSERMTGAILGQIVPLILIVMTITGAIYPAIDLTAGERERGTLETLMVAPTPTTDLIIGKFVVVTLIGLLSALLNLLSIGGTIYLGGLGSVLAEGAEIQFPLTALPWIFLLLVPMAVLFSASLLAVCSFARSFKEAQNYIVPVMLAAMIPGVVGALPGTRLEGPLMIMPVANIVVLARELLLNKFDPGGILIVFLSTSLYAAAAVAIATRLFGQEAVLFADSGSIKTLFLRRFFPRRRYPSAASALLLAAIAFSLSFFLQNALATTPGLTGFWYVVGVAATNVLLFAMMPLAACGYMKVALAPSFRLSRPPWSGLVAALAFGASTWLLVRVWLTYQATFFPMPPAYLELAESMAWISEMNILVPLLLLAVVPAVCEELFFRGFALSGLRTAVGAWPAIVIAALAFALTHMSAHRIVVTLTLGILLGMLTVRFASIVPAILAHLLHNAMSLLTSDPRALGPLVGPEPEASPPLVLGAVLLAAIGVTLCLWPPAGRRAQPGGAPDPSAAASDFSSSAVKSA